jgi:hypothetical protein
LLALLETALFIEMKKKVMVGVREISERQPLQLP